MTRCGRGVTVRATVLLAALPRAWRRLAQPSSSGVSRKVGHGVKHDGPRLSAGAVAPERSTGRARQLWSKGRSNLKMSRRPTRD